MIGRPKLSDGATRAIQLKVGEGEFADLEEWRFANRIESRSEAVRRLIQIGLRADARAAGIAKAARNALLLGGNLRGMSPDEAEDERAADGGHMTVSVAALQELMRSVFDSHEASTSLLADILAFHPTSSAMQELEKAIANRDAYKAIVRDRDDQEYEE